LEVLDAIEVLQMAEDPARQIFAILDACDDPLILNRVREIGDSAIMLYQGNAAEDFYAIAPYIVQADEALLHWISENVFMNPWGILLSSAEPIQVVRRHLRKFLLVKSPEGQELYFRFYDPRVIAPFLDSCTTEEALAFFGPIKSIFVPDASQPLRFDVLRPPVVTKDAS
jgi:hypothetical protein